MPGCPLCGEPAAEFLKLPHTAVWRCEDSSCELQFAWPQLNDQQLRDAYRKLYYPDDNSVSQHLEPTPDVVLRQGFEELLAPFGDLRGQRLLDYGCGPATLSKVATEFGMLPTGIEADANARAQIRKAGICPVYADLRELLEHEPDARFDWIVLWNVIEHLREPWNEIGELRAVLKPTGRLLATTPNAESLKARLRGASWDQRTNATHFYYFTRKALAAVLRRAGLEDITDHNARFRYPHHGPVGGLLQGVLVRLGLGGGLEFSAARGPGNPTSSAAPSEGVAS